MSASPKSQTPESKDRFDFQTFANQASDLVGSRWAFLCAAAVILVWGITGPVFQYSDTWQLIINTGTTIITFLIVFLIQNTQNRDARAIHLKLNEVIRSINQAHNEMINIEKVSDEELAELAKKYESIRAECEQRKSRKAA
jgi:low affinity Fe/Cu permease